MTISTTSGFRTATMTLGFCLVAACAHSKGDRTATSQTDEATPSKAQAVASAENTPDAPASDAARIYIDEEILAACGLTLPQAYFAFDSAKLGADDAAELQAVAECFVGGALAETSVALIGHSDPSGSASYNEELSEDRAEAVMKFLERAGVGAERIEVIPMGEDVASSDPSEWPADRRVDVRIFGDS